MPYTTGKFMRNKAVAVIAAILCIAAVCGTPLRAQSGDDAESQGSQLLGGAAPPWTTQTWINADSLSVDQLHGRVVLLRFLNDSVSSAAALRRFQALYGPQGLSVVGIYFPTPFPAQVTAEHVRELAAAQEFHFPIGVDPRWETLNRYWLDRADVELTAATFLIDRKGVIRYVQADGIYDNESAARGPRREYVKLDKEIQSLLKPDATAGAGVKKSARSKDKD